MRIHPKANANGARKRLARHANSRQNGLGKYQHTGLLVSFCLTSHKQVLDRAQPPTLQQGGSPIFIVLLGWTLAILLVLRLGNVLGLPEECGLGLGMLEAAYPRGCRENLCQGAVQETLWLLLASDLTALDADLCDTRTLPTCSITFLLLTDTSSRPPEPSDDQFRGSKDLRPWPHTPAEIRFLRLSGPRRP